MFLTIFIPVCILIGGIIYAIIEQDGVEVLSGILISIGSIIALLLFTGLIGYCLSSDEIIYNETTTPIIALEDNHSTGCAFFLGSGGTSDKMYYYYMSEQENGYKMHKVDVEKAYIKYDNEPRVIKRSGCGFKHWYNYIWAFPTQSSTTIYVPEGTILNNYNIDLK